VLFVKQELAKLEALDRVVMTLADNAAAPGGGLLHAGGRAT